MPALQLNIFMGFTFNGQFCVGIRNCDFSNLIDNCLIVLQRSAALFQIFGTNRTKENITGQGKCVVEGSSDIFFRRAMKVVAVEEEEERFAEEQTKELSRVEWEEMGKEKREPGVEWEEREPGVKKEWEGGREEESGRNGEVSDEYLGGRGLGLGGREESNGKVGKEEEGVKKEGGEGENEDREEKKRDCLQSMMKLRL